MERIIQFEISIDKLLEQYEDVGRATLAESLRYYASLLDNHEI